MLSEEYHRNLREHPPRNEDVSLITSTSAPVSTTRDAVTTTALNTTSTSADALQQKQQREERLRHALEHADPTPAEVSAVASAAYVQALMALIDQHSTDVQQMSDRLDTLQARREGYHAELAKDALQREEEAQQLRNECADLTLQVQEERERSTRLLHETTVLHTQQAEQREQLERLVELCRARGKRLRSFYHHLRSGGPRPNVSSPENDADAHVEGDEKAEQASAHPGGALCGGAHSPLSGGSPSKSKSGAASPSAPPVSLSIHKASSGRAMPYAATQGGSAFLLKDIGDDAEVAAILHLPYKVQLARTGSPSATRDAAQVMTVTADTAGTARLLALTEELNMLRQQLEEQRATYEQERGTRTRDDDARHRRAQERLAHYASTVHQLEALHEESLRELVLYRHRTDKQLRDVRGQVEWLRVALQDALALAEKERRRQHNEVYATEQRMSKHYYPKVQSLHSELAEFRRVSAAQAKDYAATLAAKDDQIAELKGRLKAEVTQRRRVEERYKLEMEGVHSELDLMRQSLRQMERRVYYSNVRDQVSEEVGTEVEGGLERYYH